MDLNSLDISGTRLEELGIWSCFKECTNGSWINIFAPNLRSFRWAFSGITERCLIQSFPLLKISYYTDHRLPSSCITMKKINYNSVLDLLSASSQVENFEISDNYLQILSGIYFKLGGLPFSFMKLKTLTIFPISTMKRYIPGMACLFKSCPVIHSLSIWFYGFNYTWEKNDMWNNQSLDDANFTQEQYWESQGQILSSFLSHLKEVEIFLGRIMIPESAIVFAKFVLKYGRGLQTIKVRFRKSSSRSSLPPKSLSKTIALIERSPRASADIKFSTTCY